MNNSEQTELWNGRAGDTWVRHNRLLDTLLNAAGHACMDAVTLTPGMRALDIGCGCGNQTLEFASRLDEDSTVVGVDISAPMLTLARDSLRLNQTNLSANVEFIEGDASRPLRPDATFDAVFSRFGVMFFDDPTGAFCNIRASMKQNTQLAFVCWQEPALNPFFTVPMQAALTVLSPPPPLPPGAPGPFGFADKKRLQSVLSDSGFRSISIEPLALTLEAGADASFDTLFDELIQIGPAAALISESEPTLQTRAREAVYEALQPFYTQGVGVSFDAHVWLVTARS